MATNNKVTSDELAYREIRSAIISGYYKSGERLIESEIAEKLELSRTPIREALKHLEKEGFLVREPYKGMMVRRFTLKEINNYYQVRSVLEALCAYLVTKNATDKLKNNLTENIKLSRNAIQANDFKLLAKLNNDFHTSLTMASGNKMLVQILDNLRVYSAIMRISIWTIPNRAQKALKEHESIVDAIIMGKKFLAAKKAIGHMTSSWENAKKLLE
ncbi:GntR family transcriptional regulator [Desulfoscipio sp. XC116]|uniref:GntR family transcriptional regulator n=1 Tax=Desulfoscipio sp. XC116 TaxID=3144975 RepID=UPI00325C20C3